MRATCTLRVLLWLGLELQRFLLLDKVLKAEEKGRRVKYISMVESRARMSACMSKDVNRLTVVASSSFPATNKIKMLLS